MRGKMNIEELNKLEEKVKVMVNRLKLVNDENKKLKSELQQLKKESSLNTEEKALIEKKVTTLIELIDSIEQ
jgi:hypothetical protein